MRGRIVHAQSPFHTSPKTNSYSIGIIKIGPEHHELILESLGGVASPEFSNSPSLRDHLGDVSQKSVESFASKHAPLVVQRDLAVRHSDISWIKHADELESELDTAFELEVVRQRDDAERDVLAVLLVALVRSGEIIKPVYLRSFSFSRCQTTAAAERVVEAQALRDEDAIALTNAVKATDGFFTTFMVSPYSRYIARWTAKRGFTPNQVTWFSLFVGIAAAVAFAQGTTGWMITGAILLQAAFTFDCVDGQLARYTRQFSRLGAWLDSVFDRGKEYVVYAGLAVGYARLHEGDSIWLLAIAALGFQTFRHLLDFSFAAGQHQELDVIEYLPIVESDPFVAYVPDGERPDDRDVERSPKRTSAVTPASSAARETLLRQIARSLLRASKAVGDAPGGAWIKRIATLPIGERFALISVTAAVFDARTTFISLLVWGSFASIYVAGGRIARSLR